MRALIQRVTKAQITNLDTQEARGFDGLGYVVLLGVGVGDTEHEAQKLLAKLIKLRIFEDKDGKTNRSLVDVDGKVLLVSPFTLFASCKKGNRPSFTDAMPSYEAEQLYEHTCAEAKAVLCPETRGDDCDRVVTGWFGAHMQIELINDGPFTIWLDTDEL